VRSLAASAFERQGRQRAGTRRRGLADGVPKRQVVGSCQASWYGCGADSGRLSGAGLRITDETSKDAVARQMSPIMALTCGNRPDGLDQRLVAGAPMRRKFCGRQDAGWNREGQVTIDGTLTDPSPFTQPRCCGRDISRFSGSMG